MILVNITTFLYNYSINKREVHYEEDIAQVLEKLYRGNNGVNIYYLVVGGDTTKSDDGDDFNNVRQGDISVSSCHTFWR